MTIKQQIRLDNPTTTTENGERVGEGHPFYEAKIAEWVANATPSPTQAAYDAADAVFNSFSKGKQALWEPVRAAVAQAILAGDVATAIEILKTTPPIYEGAEADRNLFLALFEP
jgi:hypothetical protein